MKLMMDEVALQQVSLRVLFGFSPANHDSTIAPYSSLIPEASIIL
jgi:hypothetical protein